MKLGLDCISEITDNEHDRRVLEKVWLEKVFVIKDKLYRPKEAEINEKLAQEILELANLTSILARVPFQTVFPSAVRVSELIVDEQGYIYTNQETLEQNLPIGYQHPPIKVQKNWRKWWARLWRKA